MKILLCSGFDWGLAPDLPQITSCDYVGIRRDVKIETIDEWANEVAPIPRFYLDAILQTKGTVPATQLRDEARLIAEGLVRTSLDRRSAIEICNEPNLTTQWGGKTRDEVAHNAARFREAVNACYDAIRGVSPHIDVVSGGVADVISSGVTNAHAYLKAMVPGLNRGVIVGYHTYRWEMGPDTPAEAFRTRGAEQTALMAILAGYRRANTETGNRSGPWVLNGRVWPWPPRMRRTGTVTVEQAADRFRRECELARAAQCEFVALYQQNDAEEDKGHGFGHRWLHSKDLKPIARVARIFLEPAPPDPSHPLLHVRVLDAAGKGLARVAVTFTSDKDTYPPVTAMTSATGWADYRVQQRGWGLTLHLALKDYETIDDRSRIAPLTDETWTITMARFYPRASFRVVEGVAQRPVVGAAVRIRPDDDTGAVELLTDGEGRITYTVRRPLTGAWIDIEKAGYVSATVRRLFPATSTDDADEWPPLVTLARSASAWVPSIAQCDLMQGNLLIWCPEAKPHFDTDGWDPVLQFRRRGDQPGNPVARGIEAGWVWAPVIGNYPPAQRQIIYRCARDRWGHTHFALHVAQVGAGPGYHGIFPITPAMAADYGALMNLIHAELIDAHLIPACFGVAPDAPPAPGFDTSQVRVAVTDWDNTPLAASRIRAISDAFPNARLWFELPAGNIWPEPSPDDPVPPNQGSSNPWIRGMRQKYDRFAGVLHEADINATDDQIVAAYTAKHGWWHDLRQNAGELFAYNEFWDNWNAEECQRRADAIMARCPWLIGSFGGGTMTPAPPDEGPVVDQPPVGDQIDPTTITMVDRADLMTWPATARITRLDILEVGVHVEFTKQHGNGRWPDVRPPGWDGDLQYCLGLVCQVAGHWYAAAPIQAWETLHHTGGYLAEVDVDGSGLGQIAKNWFEDGRWKQLRGTQPATGELVGFFVAAGDIRGGNLTVHERSNIVTFPMPAHGATVSLAWGGSPA